MLLLRCVYKVMKQRQEYWYQVAASMSSYHTIPHSGNHSGSACSSAGPRGCAQAVGVARAPRVCGLMPRLISLSGRRNGSCEMVTEIHS